MKVDIQPGDIFLVDSKKFAPRLVKYFMRSPTIWHDFYRMITNTLEKVRFYHVGIFYDSSTIIEQQSKVIKRSADKLLNTDNELLIVRKRNITPYEQEGLIIRAELDIGEGYDILNCFGKFLTWVTGIPYFGQYLQWRNVEVCVNRIAIWIKDMFGIMFGQKTTSDLTTHELYKYVFANLSEWEIIYRGNPREDNLLENLE